MKADRRRRKRPACACPSTRGLLRREGGKLRSPDGIVVWGMQREATEKRQGHNCWAAEPQHGWLRVAPVLINPKEGQASCCVRRNNEMPSYSDLSDQTEVPSLCLRGHGWISEAPRLWVSGIGVCMEKVSHPSFNPGDIDLGWGKASEQGLGLRPQRRPVNTRQGLPAHPPACLPVCLFCLVFCF